MFGFYSCQEFQVLCEWCKLGDVLYSLTTSARINVYSLATSGRINVYCLATSARINVYSLTTSARINVYSWQHRAVLMYITGNIGP